MNSHRENRNTLLHVTLFNGKWIFVVINFAQVIFAYVAQVHNLSIFF